MEYIPVINISKPDSFRSLSAGGRSKLRTVPVPVFGSVGQGSSSIAFQSSVLAAAWFCPPFTCPSLVKPLVVWFNTIVLVISAKVKCLAVGACGGRCS